MSAITHQATCPATLVSVSNTPKETLQSLQSRVCTCTNKVLYAHVPLRKPTPVRAERVQMSDHQIESNN